jgi:hypothetical protein
VHLSLVATAVTGDILADLMYTPACRRRHPGPYGHAGGSDDAPYARHRHLVASNEYGAWAPEASGWSERVRCRQPAAVHTPRLGPILWGQDRADNVNSILPQYVPCQK